MLSEKTKRKRVRKWLTLIMSTFKIIREIFTIDILLQSSFNEPRLSFDDEWCQYIFSKIVMLLLNYVFIQAWYLICYNCKASNQNKANKDIFYLFNDGFLSLF